MANKELFRKVYEQITQNPETHDQGDWENECGTTRCGAGWALHFHRPNQSIFKTMREVVNTGSIDVAARRVLGLNKSEADYLFYEASNEEAVEFIRHYAGIKD